MIASGTTVRAHSHFYRIPRSPVSRKQCKPCAQCQSSAQAYELQKCRRWILGGVLSLATFSCDTSPAQAEIACPGLRAYKLRECLRERREKKERESGESVRDEYLKTRQFEQPGELVTLPSGIQYSGAYFKYSSGGTPVYMFSLGYSYEGKDDVGNVYKFRLGDKFSLPAAATPAVVGMKEGGRRRILIPPSLGWVDNTVSPRPETFGGTRRLAGHRDEPLLLEVELLKAKPAESDDPGVEDGELPRTGSPFRLPAPPSYLQK